MLFTMSAHPDPSLQALRRLAGRWTSRATHPAMPGVIVNGTVDAEWLEGQRFLIWRARTDHPDFPDSISILGYVERDRAGHTPGSSAETTPRLRMHYYDSRGVFRELDASIDANAWRLERIAPGFSQRFTGTFAAGGNSIHGLGQLSRDDQTWLDDVQISYERSS
jgi:hypothetical protein